MATKEREIEYQFRNLYQKQGRLLDKGYDEDSEEYMEMQDQMDELDYKGRQYHQARMELQRDNNMKTTVKLQGDFSESYQMNEESATMKKVRQVIKKKSMMNVDGTKLDLTTASMIASVYDKVNPTNKKRMDSLKFCLLYTSPSPRDMRRSRMPSSA